MACGNPANAHGTCPSLADTMLIHAAQQESN
jgi:hypothetical protein